MLKKYSAIFLILIITYQSFGCYLSYVLWKYYMAEKIEEIASELPLSALACISMPFTGHIEKEFEQDHKMYDVIRYEISDDHITYYCINDFEEEVLKEQVPHDNDLVQLQKNCRQNAKQLIKKISKQLQWVLVSPVHKSDPAKKILLTGAYSLVSSNLHHFIIYPPPDAGLHQSGNSV